MHFSETRVKNGIYVAGPMRGYPNDNHEAFNHAAAILKNWYGFRSWNIYNPADFEAGEDDLRECMRRDMSAIINRCDSIYMLSGWENSKGARAEHALAEFLGLEIWYAEAYEETGDPGLPPEWAAHIRQANKHVQSGPGVDPAYRDKRRWVCTGESDWRDYSVV